MVLSGLLIAAAAAAGPSFLTPSSRGGFPGWFAGPLAGISPGRLSPGAFGVLFLLMCAAYLVVVTLARHISPRAATLAVLALHAVFVLAPSLLTTDVFGYLAYARIGALEGLNPYTTGADALRGDPVHPFVVWHEDPSPYGPLFTVASYGLAPLGVAGGLWALKAAMAAASLGIVALVWATARRLGRDPVAAAVFVGLNPLVLVHVVGGGHNDALMMLLVMGGVAAAVAGRDRLAGGALAGALGIKAAALVLVPFVVLACRRRGAALAGLAAGILAIALLALLAIGPGVVQLAGALADQAAYVSTNSPQYLVSRALGLGSVSAGVRLGANVVLVVVLAGLFWWALRGGDRLAATAWAATATLATSVWLMPWYALWVLPAAALAPGRGVRVGALVLCGAVVVTRTPLPLG